MKIDFVGYKSYLDERVKYYPFIKDMVDLYKGLIDIWDKATTDDLSPLFCAEIPLNPPLIRRESGGFETGLSRERLSGGGSMLDMGKIGDIDFVNSVDTARKIFNMMEEHKMAAAIMIANPSMENIVEFIKAGLSREDRYKNAILKWTLKPSFNHLFHPFNKGGLRGIWEKVNLSWNVGRCPVCSAPPGMALVIDNAEGNEQRFLSCCFCGYRWLFSIIACPACGNNKPEKHGFFVGDPGCEQGTRAISCEECKTYIKTLFTGCREDMRKSEELDMDIEDVATLPLDIISNQRGYSALCQM